MDSSIWVAVMANFPAKLAFVIIAFWARGTCGMQTRHFYVQGCSGVGRYFKCSVVSFKESHKLLQEVFVNRHRVKCQASTEQMHFARGTL
jgi:hypothetical protein